MKNINFAVIGGDMRQVYISEGLASLGYTVCDYALCAKTTNPSICHASSIEEAICATSAIIGPVPLVRNRVFNHQTSNTDLALEDLSSILQSGQYFFAGSIPESFNTALLDKGVSTCDFMNEEEIAFYNTIATAEGAICEAISRSPYNLHRSSCLVLGYGKCGRTLVSYLKGMFCNVTVCARSSKARAEARILADQAIDMHQLTQNPEHFTFIFNTVPDLMLTKNLLEKLDSNTLIIDIATAPGGVDYEAAAKLKLSAHLCPGLPGKYAPKSSADAMIRFITHQL